MELKELVTHDNAVVRDTAQQVITAQESYAKGEMSKIEYEDLIASLTSEDRINKEASDLDTQILLTRLFQVIKIAASSFHP